MFARITIALSLALSATALAQNTPVYAGQGGLHSQRVGAIECNSLLAPNGSVTVSAGGSNRRIYVRFLADTGRNVDGFELSMRSNSGQLIRPASLYSANANSKPQTPLAQGVIGIGTSFDWCHATFSSTYRVVGGLLYFMAFDLHAGETVEMRTTTAANYRTVAYFTSATGTAQFQPLRYRVDTDGERMRLHSGPTGLGMTVPVDCTGLPAGALAFLVLGYSNQITSTSRPLPCLAGSPFVDGSIQYIAFDAIAGAGYADSTGTIRGSVSYTSNPAYLGFTFFQQWAGLVDPSSGSWALSNYARLQL